MGRKPHSIREFEAYLKALKALLRGEEAPGDDVIFAAGAANGVRAAWHLIDADADGRALSRENFPTSTLTTIVVLEEGERGDSDRVKQQCGAMAMVGGGVIGTRDQLIDRLSAMHEAGLGQVVILPNFDTRFDVLESVAENLVGHIA